LIGDQSRGKLFFLLFLFYSFFFNTMVLYFRFFSDLPFILYFTPREDTAGPWRRVHTRGRWNNRHDRTKVYRSVKVQTCLCTTFGSQSLNFTMWINYCGKERQISRLIIQLKNAMFIEIFCDEWQSINA